MDVNSLSHTRWECKYHILFAPKFRRKVAYGELKQDIANILSMLCKRKGVEIIEAEICPDHVHMLVRIPPSMSVSNFVGYLKGKSTLMIFERHANLKYKYRTVAVTVLANLCDLQQHAATLQPCAYRKYFQRNALYSQIFSKGSRIDISAFSSECIDFFLRQQTYLSVPVTSMRITLDSLVRTQPCGIQRFFLRASFFADTDGCNCACLYCLFHHYPPICTICLFSVIFSLVSKQCICGFARITRCSSSRICS